MTSSSLTLFLSLPRQPTRAPVSSARNRGWYCSEQPKLKKGKGRKTPRFGRAPGMAGAEYDIQCSQERGPRVVLASCKESDVQHAPKLLVD
jgi:hypothetical protein